MIDRKTEAKFTRIDYVWKMPDIRTSNKKSIDYISKSNKGITLRSSALAALVPLTTTIVAQDLNQGIFWETFLQYIFPYMMDIAKVFCAIKIAQAFYTEKRGGRDEGTGMSAFVTYGKWYLLFSLLPWGVELIDQLGKQMINNLG